MYDTSVKNNGPRCIQRISLAPADIRVTLTRFHFAGKQPAGLRDESVHVRIGPLPQVHFNRQDVAYQTERRQWTMQEQREQTAVVLQLFFNGKKRI